MTLGSEQIVTFRSRVAFPDDYRLTGSRVPRAAGGPLPLQPPHPPHLRRRVQGRKLLRVFSVAQASRPGALLARRADLQKLRNPAKAPGCPDLFLLSPNLLDLGCATSAERSSM